MKNLCKEKPLFFFLVTYFLVYAKQDKVRSTTIQREKMDYYFVNIVASATRARDFVEDKDEDVKSFKCKITKYILKSTLSLSICLLSRIHVPFRSYFLLSSKIYDDSSAFNLSSTSLHIFIYCVFA